MHGRDVSAFDMFRKMQASGWHSDQFLFGWIADDRSRIREEFAEPGDRVRCIECWRRYGKAAPWDCGVCESVWAKCYPMKIQKRGCPDGIANLIDLALCPTRPRLCGRVHEVSGIQKDNSWDLEAFLQAFEQRLNRLHNGQMTLVRETEHVKILEGWMMKRIKTVSEPTLLRHFCRINVYGKEFLAAFLLSDNVFYGMENFFVAVIDN
ncbi:unnamed protein product, partial [Mesorhabditis spiculigera]